MVREIIHAIFNIFNNLNELIKMVKQFSFILFFKKAFKNKFQIKKLI